MTFFIINTITMAIINLINGFFTYKIFKQLSSGSNMNNEELKKIIQNEMNPKYNTIDIVDFTENISPSVEFNSLSIGGILKEGDVVEKQSFVSGSSFVVNPPPIEDAIIPCDGEDEILNRLLFLSDYLSGKYKPKGNVEPQEFEDMKWETINEVYCLITIGLPRFKAEHVRKYFRRLDTTYSKKDGTYYSKVTEGRLSREIIDDLIASYPWSKSDGIEDTIKVNPENTNPNKINERHIDRVNYDNLKYAIENLSKSVEKLNEILSCK